MINTAQQRDLEADSIWKGAIKVTDYVLEQIETFPEEEKWETVSKLRASANNFLYCLAGAVGNGTFIGNNYEWGGARKNAVSLRAFLHIVNKRKLAKIEPEIMVTLDNLIKEIDKELRQSLKVMEEAEKEEEQKWQRRYDAWRMASKAEEKAMRK